MRLLISILLCFICTYSFAQIPKEAMERVTVINAPFNATRMAIDGVLGCSIVVDEGVLSRKIYSNAQLTEWWDMKDSSDNEYYCCVQFDNPSHKNNYFYISLNDNGDFWTCILASVDPEGNIADYIDARVLSGSKFGIAAVMNYRIADNGDVIISRIVPTSTTSIPLGYLNDFHGYRQDITYRLDKNGKFQVVDSVKFVPQLYTAQMLSNRDYTVWNGNEIIAEQ